MAPLLRQARRDELDTIIDWAAREGWNPGLADASAFWVADPNGFFVAEEEGTLAAALSVVRFGETYAFLGFYMAHPDFRGQGIGYALWHYGLSAVGERTVGLDGVVAQQENYARSGFVYSHANFRYGGEVTCAEPPGKELVEVAPVLVPAIIDYDERLSGVRRETFLKEWLKPSEVRLSFAYLRGTAVAGYGTIRACREGHKIGPLFADSDTTADLIFRKLVASTGGGLIYLDSPEPNSAARDLCARYNMIGVFETARMYRGPAPDMALPRIYGITTFELG
ncbi:GNAT family N-acetyltransferase [Xaviernesmea oryzae]|uniref:GNAT family N-acetyltransferase n=1 Tax=Xaviernesmea oryzae TaxID=464029 RepID=A0A1Q9AT45_9HYPH|nr:GNAT family N-acetyltransferase [Xaviernesmea oryzae]OLP58531.1 GNAT family N-acetyltransferase [Xaviernesmea oryzae]SEK60891.1 hypothetical protein SAMN04487976_10377 [Xaviernesmea oryzae]